ncbi:expressed unknown protein [Ectocarpus siliculosus]|uniref:Uncharacterized protein n=1 Tax=Ectocarpus siliculosus TaxID=2880 RepID=D7FJU0_ECTSI|nr:expressed unknown protein [Ectocarpus siliculosus]|eukprot:CBJ29192.1 expressed unknown protein [Ectocarpus siliculosus]
MDRLPLRPVLTTMNNQERPPAIQELAIRQFAVHLVLRFCKAWFMARVRFDQKASENAHCLDAARAFLAFASFAFFVFVHAVYLGIYVLEYDGVIDREHCDNLLRRVEERCLVCNFFLSRQGPMWASWSRRVWAILLGETTESDDDQGGLIYPEECH